MDTGNFGLHVVSRNEQHYGAPVWKRSVRNSGVSQAFLDKIAKTLQSSRHFMAVFSEPTIPNVGGCQTVNQPKDSNYFYKNFHGLLHG